MKWYSTIVYAIGIAFCAALAVYPKTAPAQHTTYQGTGVVCDEPEQVLGAPMPNHPLTS